MRRIRRPKFDVRKLYVMHKRLAHGYYKVDFVLIWKTKRKDLPELHEQVRHLTEPQN